MERIPRQRVVRNKETGKIGVTCEDLPPPLDCCSEEETNVVYEGNTAGVGTPTEILEIIGPENAKADPQKCGAGRGEECCIFLALAPNGFECQRFGPLRWDLIFRKEKMGAKREPDQLYPACQLSV